MSVAMVSMENICGINYHGNYGTILAYGGDIYLVLITME